MQKQLFFLLLAFTFFGYAQKLPKGFVYLSNIDTSIQSELRYYGSNNFIGKPIEGYYINKIIVSKQTALALQKVQTTLKNKNLSLKIFDAYRPQQAVNHFVRWAKAISDTLMKAEYYPNIPKRKLFQLGFIASKSGHTRGSTVDLTLVNTTTGKKLDMGSTYDFFGEESHPFYKKISKKQQQNRLLLRKVLLAEDFIPYDNEWWHFTLKNEPFPDTYFNFPIK